MFARHRVDILPAMVRIGILHTTAAARCCCKFYLRQMRWRWSRY
eukprot:IDg18706t1